MDEKILETAEKLAEATVQNGIDKIRAQVKPRDPSFDGLCEDCGEAIPEARLNTGACRCIECQQYLERYQAQFRR